MENATQSGSVETYIRELQPLFLTLILIVIARFIINYIVSSLLERGRITYTTRSIFMRTIDVTLLFIAIVVILHTFFAPYQIIIVIISLVVILAVIFFYELREFIAYINLQLMRRIQGRVFEIHLPHHNKPIYGRVVSINPLETIIEDLYGRRIYISNSLLMNSILREHVYSITLRVELKNIDSKLSELLNRIIKSIKSIDSRVFRVDERKITIDEVSDNKCVLKIVVNPIILPIKTTDLLEFVDQLSSILSNYSPFIEIVEST